MTFKRSLTVGGILSGLFLSTAGHALTQQAEAGPSEAQIRAAATPIITRRGARAVESGKAAVFVNGVVVDFGGAPLLSQQGRLLVPLRAISEAAGAIVTYDAATRTISIQRGARVVTVQPGSVTSRVMVPLRFVGESLGAQVQVAPPGVRADNVTVIFIAWPPEPSAAPEVPFAVPPPTPPNASPPSAVLDANDAAIQHNVDKLNAYRAQNGAPPLQLDKELTAFAQQGSVELMQNHRPHGHFKSADIWSSGFRGGAAENQGDPHGWPMRGGQSATIDAILQAMINEGPGGGHHDNILNPRYRRVGVGLVVSDSKLYLTNDFSE